ncbi:MAG: hypothetical protein M3077_08480 [Candidatus Dormibacteraeota bacterium]|nr:hypothetical protein [Candidatus Dormibacteraeota bacterium]
MRRLAVACTSLLGLVACSSQPASTSPTPTVRVTPTSTTIGALKRQPVSDAALVLPASTPVLMFQVFGDDHLRAITWDGLHSGIVGTPIGQFVPWSQSPDGSRFVAGATVYDRAGRVVGAFPWPTKDISAVWSGDGRLWRAEPLAPQSGFALTLQAAAPGATPRTVSQTFGIYQDQASYPVMAANPAADVAIVGTYNGISQYPAARPVWIIRLSTGRVTRLINEAIGAVSADGMTVAEAGQSSAGNMLTTIRRTGDGASLGSVPGVTPLGFSGDGSLLVGAKTTNDVVLVDWRSGRILWTSSSHGLPYGGMIAEPGGRRVAIGFGFVGGSDDADVYIVDPSAPTLLLPAKLKASLRY